ncbi:coiled-coil domain-containing protein 96 [Trichomycterus rosablanca]|uniref:coiled-coil domain-containing protein 96 n=1 Tax=Trichomycterus rosablanca TaxID=2290929 RepID=UPI002F35AA9D
MEKQLPEEMSSALESEDPNITGASEDLDSEKITKPEAETSHLEVEETVVTEEEEEVNTHTAEIESEAAVVDNPANVEEGKEPDVEPHVGEHLSQERSVTDQEDGEQKLEERDAPKLESLVGKDQQCTVTPADLKINHEEQQELLRELQAEQDQLTQLNYQLQAKLANYFQKPTNRPPSGRDQAIPDQEQHYQKYLNMMEDLKLQKNLLKQQVDDLHQQSREKLEQVEREWRVQASTKREVIVTALSRTKGKAGARAEAERLQGAEQRRQDELVSVRLENVMLQMEVHKLEGAHSGRKVLHQIDFEQLKMENQTYSEKIEERHEELHKLKKKINNTVQILTHMKEKLQFIQTENQNEQTHLAELNDALQRDREALTKTKQAREALTNHNLRLRQQCGMLGNTTLLRDLEDTEDEREALERRVETLKSRHAQLTVRSEQMKKNLEQRNVLNH